MFLKKLNAHLMFVAIILNEIKISVGRFNSSDEYKQLTVPEIVAKDGYQIEIYTVISEDGYILTIHRILNTKNYQNAPVVFLQHGLLCSSACWILSGPKQAFAYLLADSGYDVWLGNARGTTYSKKHEKLNPNQDAFWDYSWDEIGFYDLPAMIDFVLKKTNQENLIYIGHSEGTTVFYVMCSLRPEYNSKIKVHFSLSPIGFMNHVKSTLTQALSHVANLPKFSQDVILGRKDFKLTRGFKVLLGETLCDFKLLSKETCGSAIFLLFGFDQRQVSASDIELFVAHISTVSVKEVLHYAQEILSGYFRKYDSGIITNKKRYGTGEPPSYDLSKITATVYLVCAQNDLMSSLEDVKMLEEKLPNVQKILVSDPQWNHGDFIWGIDAKTYVYDIVMEKMGTYLYN